MTNYKLTIILTVVGLAVFTIVVTQQIIRLKAVQWTFFDVIIVAAICFIVIWIIPDIIPDIINIVRQWRGRNQQ